MSTGKIDWQNKFPRILLLGAVTTAGGLVFVGQNNGELVAYKVETGEELWSFQTGAGADTTVTPFEDEGEEKIAIYAGGNSLAATAHGENFWVFSLNGTMEAAERTGTEEEGTSNREESPKRRSRRRSRSRSRRRRKAEEAESEGGKPPTGARRTPKSAKKCLRRMLGLPRRTGHGGNGGPDLGRCRCQIQEGAKGQVTNGGGGMPASKASLSEEEIRCRRLRRRRHRRRQVDDDEEPESGER